MKFQMRTSRVSPLTAGQTVIQRRSSESAWGGQLLERPAVDVHPAATPAGGGDRRRFPQPPGRRAGRGAVRRGLDSLDRVPAAAGAADRLRRGHRLRRPGAKRQALRPRADRARGNAGPGRRLAHQRGPGPDPARRAFWFEAALAALAAGKQAGRLSRPMRWSSSATVACWSRTRTWPLPGTWARSGRVGPACPLFLPCGPLGRTCRRSESIAPWPPPAMKA